MANVVRILAAAALVAIIPTGCGGTGRSHRSAVRGLPPKLARAWAAQASAIADASAAGNNCRASRLASSLRDDVIQAEGRVPARLQKPLVAGVNALADRITCIPKPPPPPPQRHEKPKPPKPGHDHHHHHGDGGDQGSRS